MTKSTVIAAIAAALAAAPFLSADSMGAAFSNEYSFSILNALPLSGLGGLVIDPFNPNVLLIGASAAGPSGAIYEVGLSRNPITQQITGLSGAPTVYASAPDNDGGLVFAPNGDLLFTEYPDNAVGELKPGSTTPDKYTSPFPSNQGSDGGLTFIPAGFSGAGDAVFTSYNQGYVCASTASLNAQSEYTFGPCVNAQIGGTLEGILYVPAGTPGFSANSVLIQRDATLMAYQLDANGLPITNSGVVFFSGSANEGLAFDALSGDFLMTNFNHGTVISDIYVVAPLQAAPEPASFVLSGLGLVALIWRRRAVSGLRGGGGVCGPGPRAPE